jgi:hypothetical protein
MLYIPGVFSCWLCFTEQKQLAILESSPLLFDVVSGQQSSNLDGHLDSRKLTEDGFSLGIIVLTGRLRAQHICFWLYLFFPESEPYHHGDLTPVCLKGCLHSLLWVSFQ